MRRLIILPNGWKCTLEECPPGHFTFEDSLYFKGDYGKSFNGAGEFLCLEDSELVQPVRAHWEEYEY